MGRVDLLKVRILSAHNGFFCSYWPLAAIGVRTRPRSGIAGMRERALALGGHLAAGPATDGGFVVTAHLPGGVGR